MKGKGGMALMIAIGKKKPGMGSEDDGPPSSKQSLSDGEDYGMELESMTKSFFEAGMKGKYKTAASIFKEMHSSCMDGSEED
jgi:hypothetical protein